MLIKVGLQIALIALFLSGCVMVLVVSGYVRDKGQENILSNARDADEAEKILHTIFSPGVSTVVEIENYIKSSTLNCTEFQHTDNYDGNIVCWLPASHAEVWDKLDWVSKLVNRYTFRVVFWFEEAHLSTIEIILDDVGL